MLVVLLADFTIVKLGGIVGVIVGVIVLVTEGVNVGEQ